MTQHESTTVRMNHAAGLAGNGDMLALVSGWPGRLPAGLSAGHLRRDTFRSEENKWLF